MNLHHDAVLYVARILFALISIPGGFAPSLTYAYALRA